MNGSGLSKVWNALKPPPPVNRPGAREHKKRQRRLLTIAFGAVILLAAGGGVFYYISSAPQRADKQFQEGMKLMKPGTYAEAIVHFTRALDIYSQLPDAYLERGSAHRYMNQDDLALEDFEKALDLDPNLPAAHNGICMIYLERHDAKHALEALSKSIAVHPTVDAYYQRGQIFETNGEHQKAIEDYDKAVDEKRDSPYIYRARALAKMNLGDAAGAQADRQQADVIEGRHSIPQAAVIQPASTP